MPQFPIYKCLNPLFPEEIAIQVVWYPEEEKGGCRCLVVVVVMQDVSQDV